MLKKEEKAAIFKKYGKSEKNTGSTEGQIALFTKRINDLTGHLKNNHKDYNTERSLVMLVGKRRSLLDYLKDKDIERYRSLIKELGIRKYALKSIRIIGFSRVSTTTTQHHRY